MLRLILQIAVVSMSSTFILAGDAEDVKKHIEVVILAPEKAAVALYYSEGYLKPKGSKAVDHYLTRVSQAFVKENGEWRTRTSHWSPVKGGYGTSQTGKE